MKQTPLPASGFTEFSCDNRYKKVYKVHQDICFKERCESTSLRKPQAGTPGARLPRAVLWVGGLEQARLFAQTPSRYTMGPGCLMQFCWWVGNGSDRVGASQAVCPNTSRVAVPCLETDAHTRTCGGTDRPSGAWRPLLGSFTENRCCDGKAQDVTDRPKCISPSLEDPFTPTHSQASPQFKVVTSCIAVYDLAQSSTESIMFRQ